MKNDDKIATRVAEYFKDKPVLKAYFFGSFVRPDTENHSDIDILVDLDYSEPVGLEFIKMKSDLQKIVNCNVDLVTEKALSKHIKPKVDKEKKLIYEK